MHICKGKCSWTNNLKYCEAHRVDRPRAKKRWATPSIQGHPPIPSNKLYNGRRRGSCPSSSYLQNTLYRIDWKDKRPIEGSSQKARGHADERRTRPCHKREKFNAKDGSWGCESAEKLPVESPSTRMVLKKKYEPKYLRKTR